MEYVEPEYVEFLVFVYIYVTAASSGYTMVFVWSIKFICN